jgi:hypothetical protein
LRLAAPERHQHVAVMIAVRSAVLVPAPCRSVVLHLSGPTRYAAALLVTSRFVASAVVGRTSGKCHPPIDPLASSHRCLWLTSTAEAAETCL